MTGMQVARILSHRFGPLGVLVCVLMMGVAQAGSIVRVALSEHSPRLDFGWERLQAALRDQGFEPRRLAFHPEVQAAIVVVAGEPQARQLGHPDWLDPLRGPEDFRLLRRSPAYRGTLVIAARSDRGAMYGLLETAELIRRYGHADLLPERVVHARLSFRAIKFNLPWMSYRKSPALQVHDQTCRDLGFWEAFLDMMAENRFNALTLWNLHPFHYLIRPKNFPEACPFPDEELADWQQFWHRLFQMARDRGIETYLVNWNIFVSPEFARAHNVATYSIDWKFFGKGDTSELVERYTRECVTQLLQEYPELTGLGITLGEGMGGMSPEERRDWLERTFIAGVRAAGRPVRFIHRAPLSANTGSGGSVSRTVEQLTREAIERMDCFKEPILVEFKYNWSHGHSSPQLHMVHGGPLTDTYWNPPPTNYRVVWTVRNEDFFVLRWGDPDFVRAFLANNTPDYVAGCLIGSECYIPAKDYIHAPGPHRSWRYAFERQWLFYQVWGRLLYDPTTPDAVFADELEKRYGRGFGDPLLTAWRTASRVPLRMARFYRGTWDGTLYCEGHLGVKRGSGAGQFIDIDTFIHQPTLEPAYMNIADFVRAGCQAPAGRFSPLDVAGAFREDADRVFAIVERIRDAAQVSPTLDCELKDLEAWAWMGRYLAAKIEGGVALETFRVGGDPARQKQAIRALEEALCYWRKVADVISSHNRPTVPYVFDANFSWLKHVASAQADVQTAIKAVPQDSVDR